MKRRSPSLLISAQRATDFIRDSRNSDLPWGAWGYESEPNGYQDTSVTGWMIFATRVAEDCGLNIDSSSYRGARRWIDHVTEHATGRIGYNSKEPLSARAHGYNDQFRTDRTETMTAVGLLSRFFLGQDPNDPIMRKHASLLLSALPEESSRDLYYWYHGTYAMYKMGDDYWKKWDAAMKEVVLDSQHKDGSWDPDGPWGFAGGRVYSTAMACLCLSVYYSE